MKIRKHLYILAVFTVFALLTLSACGKSTDSGIIQYRRGTGVKTESANGQDNEAVTETEEVSGESGLYVIVKIDTEQEVAAFQKVDSGRQSQYAYDTGTMFLDKYGNTKSAASFLPGDVARIEVSASTQQLRTVQLSDEVWVQEDIVNYSVDESIHAFTIGQTRYSYDPEMDIFSGENRVGFASVGKSDVLRAVGIGKKLISLAITKGHGYLILSNTTLFDGSFICVGDKIFEEVTPNMQIEVPEGKHLVTVANNGYGGSKEVTITREQTTNLNLEELKGEGPQICKITFDVGVEGAVLRIDGKETDYSGPVEVQYGVHTISVEAEGYDTITNKLVVNSKEAEIEIALTAASAEDSSKEEDGSSDNNSTQTDNTNGSSNSDNSSNTNNNTDTNSSSTNNTNTDNSNTNSSSNDSSSTDYLTTLYNLLTSINNTNNSNTNNSSTDSSNTSSSYEDLSDG